MKARIIIITSIFFMSAIIGFGQDIAQSEVPSIILNNLKKDFPKATDIEWKKKSDLYQVEFETDDNKDLEIWYDKLGAIVKQEEEISPAQVPTDILTVVKEEFAGFEVDEAKKILQNGRAEYHLELESRTEEWEVVFAPNGEILSKKAD